MKKLLLICLIAFFALSIVEIVNAPPASAVTSQIMEKAKQEGKVVWYTTMPGSGRKAVKKLFEKTYPLKLEMFQAGSLDIVGRYQAELVAKRVKVDCIHITDMVFFLDMMEKGNLLRYDSPEFEAYRGLPEGWVYPGYITPLRVMPIGSLVNTKVTDWKAIKGYSDMLIPKFKGMIAAGDVATSTRAYINYYGLRNKYGVGWYKKLVEMEAQYYESSEKAMNNCLSGQWPILFEAWIYKDFEFRIKKKAPVHAIFPKEGTVVLVCPNTIMKQAPHPNAAKVFQDFLYSKEGQAAIGKAIGVHSGRSDVSAPAGLPKISEMNVIGVDFKDAKAKRKELVEEWRGISGR
jgi:iron(III) transport system substrate-binding protein